MAKTPQKSTKPASAKVPPKPAPRRKAPAPLSAGLVLTRDASPAATLTAPAVPVPALELIPPPQSEVAPKRRARGPNKVPVEKKESFAFKVPVAWAKEFRRYSAERGTELYVTLFDAFEALKEKETL